MTKNEVKNNMVCPNCGSHDIVFVTTTDALFEVNPDGSIGKPVLDADGIECISEGASQDVGNVEVRCRNCHSSFSVYEKDENDWGHFVIDSEL